MKDKVTQRIIAYVENALPAAEAKAFAAELELNADLRAMESGLRSVLRAESNAARDEGELPQAFDDAVMRRIRVAPPPQSHMSGARPDVIFSSFRETIFGSTRMQAIFATTCSLLLIVALSPDLRGSRPTLSGEHANYLSMYDATGDASSARIINAMTARIPAGYRAVSLDVKGWSRPGEHVDVVWLAELQSKSVSALIIQNARVLSNERDPSAGDDAEGMSTVTILVRAEDAAKVELARATGVIALSPRDGEIAEENPVEEFILRGGSLIPKA